MSFEVPTALVHAYEYSSNDPHLPGPFGTAVATAARLLYETGLISSIYLSGRSLAQGYQPIAEVTANPIRENFPALGDNLIVEHRAGTTYGEVRDYRNFLAKHGNPSSTLIDIAARDHIPHIKPLYKRLFPSQEIKFYSFEDVLRRSPYPEHQEQIAELVISSEYQTFKRYMENQGWIYWLQQRLPFLNELVERSDFLAQLKHRNQMAVVGWYVPQ